MTDRRYGINKYGDGKLYGASDTRDALIWDISIDWDDDGFHEENEASRLTNINITRGRSELLQSAGEGFQEVETGRAIVTLRNDDGRFDAWNSVSPLYPNVNYGKDIRIRVRDMNASDAIYPLFRGTITNLVPVGYGDDAKIMIYASDGLEYLRSYVARVAIQESITPDEALDMVLNSVKWPAKFGRDLEPSSETIRYWWASGNKQAMSEARDLATSFLGYFFVDATGQARFVTRQNVSAPVVNFAQENLLKDIDNPQPYQIQRSITRLKVHPRVRAATGVIWELVGTTPSISPGAANALTLFANFTYDNQPAPAVDVITPVATTDYLVNTQQDGSGSNLTGSCTVTLTDFGDSAKLTITNNSGSTGYITFLRVRGDAIHEPNVSDVTYPSDPDTVTVPRELMLDLLWQQDINVAVDIASVLGPFYAGRHPMPKVKIQNYPSLQFSPDLFDIVTADLNHLGLIGNSFRVGYIEHQTIASENCQSVLSTFSLEPYVSADEYMQWDIASAWDSETVFGY